MKVGRLSVHHTYGGKGAPPVLFVHGLGSSGYIEWRFTLPAIAHLSAGHYVVLYAQELNGLVIGDPAHGVVTVTTETFRRAWTGNLLLLLPPLG